MVGPLVQEYGSQLVIMGLNISTDGGSQFYTAAMAELAVPQERQVIPFILIGEHLLIGSDEVTKQLPDLVADGFASGGISWPEVDALDDLFVDAEATLVARTPAAQTAAAATAAAPGLAAPASAEPGATAPTVPTAATPMGPAPAPTEAIGASSSPTPAGEAAPLRDGRATAILLAVGVLLAAGGLVLAIRRRG